jgi:hypothetical protein
MRRMIVFDLLCAAGHRFEGWFGSAIDFSAQKERLQLSCPSCGTSQVERVPSASRVNLGAAPPKRPPAAPERTQDMQGKDPFAIAQMLYSRMLDELLTKSEDVGADFPSAARKIFYHEAPARAIRGQASNEEHEQLLEEGIPVARLPVPPGDKLN